MNVLIVIVNATVNVFSILILIYSLLSFILGPFHPIRQTLGQVVEPMLTPIRKVVPAVGGLDFSPLILMILIQVVGSVLISILRSLS
jgi:YggT family protein